MQYEAVQKVFQSMQNYSNFPLPSDNRDENVKFCELFTVVIFQLWTWNKRNLKPDVCFQRHYFVHDFMVDRSIFPWFTPTGRYRLLANAYEETRKDAVMTVEFVGFFTWNRIFPWINGTLKFTFLALFNCDGSILPPADTWSDYITGNFLSYQLISRHISQIHIGHHVSTPVSMESRRYQRNSSQAASQQKGIQ